MSNVRITNLENAQYLSKEGFYIHLRATEDLKIIRFKVEFDTESLDQLDFKIHNWGNALEGASLLKDTHEVELLHHCPPKITFNIIEGLLTIQFTPEGLKDLKSGDRIQLIQHYL